MGFRLQRRIKVLPGLTINVSKSGVSTSIGVTGARITYGHGKKRVTTGIPGTGISHTSISNLKEDNDRRQNTKQSDLKNIAIFFAVAIFLLLLFGVKRY